MTPNNAAPSSELRLSITREFKAPCDLVFRAWTDPKLMAQWWCPEGVECRSISADVKTGGTYRIHMVSPKGDHIAFGKYLEIIPNQRVQFTWQYESYAMPDSIVTLEFEDLGNTTRLTLIHAGLPDQEDVSDHNRGWTSLMDKLVRLTGQNLIKA